MIIESKIPNRRDYLESCEVKPALNVENPSMPTVSSHFVQRLTPPAQVIKITLHIFTGPVYIE